MSKVFHVSDVLHTKVKDHCETNKINMKEWVELVIGEAIISGKIVHKDIVLKKLPPVNNVDLSQEPESTEPKPWSLPPFWENKG